MSVKTGLTRWNTELSPFWCFTMLQMTYLDFFVPSVNAYIPIIKTLTNPMT